MINILKPILAVVSPAKHYADLPPVGKSNLKTFVRDSVEHVRLFELKSV
jgi:hypothetical protein